MKILQIISIMFSLGLTAALPVTALATEHQTGQVEATSAADGSREPATAGHRRETVRSENFDSEQDRRILERGRISQGQYITGGVIGSIFGFGIGHGIQHRYGEKGWIFTTSGVVGLSLYAVGLSSCTKRNISSTDSNQTLDCPSGAVAAVAAGLAINLGFHIWEIVDLWVAPPKQNRRYDELRGTQPSVLETTRVFPVALANTDGSSTSIVPGLGVSLNF